VVYRPVGRSPDKVSRALVRRTETCSQRPDADTAYAEDGAATVGKRLCCGEIQFGLSKLPACPRLSSEGRLSGRMVLLVLPR